MVISKTVAFWMFVVIGLLNVFAALDTVMDGDSGLWAIVQGVIGGGCLIVASSMYKEMKSE